MVERGHRHGLIAPSCIRLVDMRADRARGCAVERRCGTWPALILATVMPLTAAAGSAALAWPVRASNLEGTAMLLWWVCILVGNVMLGPVTRWTGVSSLRMLKLGVYVWSVAQFATTIANPLCRRGPGAVGGAVLSAASLAVVTRAWQLFNMIEKARKANSELEWTLGHRMFFMSAIAWHDADSFRAMEPKAKRQEMTHLLSSIMRWCGAAVTCVWLALTTSGAELKFTGGLVELVTSGCATCLNVVAGAVIAVAGFFLTDRLVRLSHVLVNELKLPSLMGKRLFLANSLTEFWREWNLPVQRLLHGGVYKRAVGCGMSRDVSKALCFIVSGACHAAPLACAGVAIKWQLFMMAFFVIQIPLLAIESALRLRGKVYLYAVLISAIPLFLHPLTKGIEL